jgi:alpha-L-rhamnosidase
VKVLIDPVGIDTTVPRLAWQMAPIPERRGLRQSAYHVVAGSTPGAADVWDSGRVESAESVSIEYGGAPLRSGQRVYWRVRVWDEAGQVSDWSPAALFEMGLLSPGDWSAQWISGALAGGPRSEVPLPYLRKEFTLPAGEIRSARLYVSALGVYEFYLNGRRVGDDVFAPGWTDYRHRVQYQVHDVTSLLRGGANAAGAILGDGWYSGYLGYREQRGFYGDRPALLAQLVLQFADGKTQTIVTDDTWKVTQNGPLLSSDMQMGESYDARREMPRWAEAGFDDSSWQVATPHEPPAAALVAMRGPTVRAAETLHPVNIKSRHKHPNSHAYTLDLGQNMVGRLRLRIPKPIAGQTITLRFAEVLDKNTTGNLYTANLRTAKQTDVYTMRGDGGEEVYESRFTFHGFRYVDIDGYPGELTKEDVAGIVLHSDMSRTGQFECSEPLVNQLQHNIVWGQKGNFIDVPTDCPQRNERLGWTGDAQVFVRTAAFNFDVWGFFNKWCLDLRDAQTMLGTFPPVVPNLWKAELKDGVELHVDGGPAWADAGVICPWTIYTVYGDRRLLEEHYPAAVRYVEHLRKTAEPFGLIRSHPDWPGFGGYGDWLATDAGRENVMGLTPHDLIGTAFLAHSAQLVSQMATELGRLDEAKQFLALRDRVTDAFMNRFVTKDGLIVANTQTGYVLALHFDLLPESLRPRAVSELVRLINRAGGHLTTGFVGTPYLLHVLSRFGRLDVAYKLLLQKTYPSWLYPVTLGATTIWERWDGWTEAKGFQDAGMNSFNHYAYGAVGDWLYRVVAGLDTEQPGYRKLHLRPLPGGGLTHAAASLETMYGLARSAWNIHGDTLTWNVQVPPNTTAIAHLPAKDLSNVRESGQTLAGRPGISVDGNAIELVSGEYTFDLPWQPA